MMFMIYDINSLLAIIGLGLVGWLFQVSVAYPLVMLFLFLLPLVFETSMFLVGECNLIVFGSRGRTIVSIDESNLQETLIA